LLQEQEKQRVATVLPLADSTVPASLIPSQIKAHIIGHIKNCAITGFNKFRFFSPIRRINSIY
jgi:hypothetical protein